MKLLLFFPFLLGLSFLTIAHNEFNGGEGADYHAWRRYLTDQEGEESEEGEDAETYSGNFNPVVNGN